MLGQLLHRAGYGLDISREALRMAEVAAVKGGARALSSIDSASLPSGVLVESLTEPNIRNVPAFVGAVRGLVRKGGRRRKSVNVTLPDTVARVAMLEFDSVPAKQGDIESMLMWRFKKLVPFSVDKAVLKYQYLGPARDQGATRHRFAAAVMRHQVLEQYESAFISAGLRPARIDISTFAVWNLFHDYLVAQTDTTRQFGLLNVSGTRMTVLVFERGVLRFIRFKDMAAFGPDESAADELVDSMVRELHASLTYYKENFSSTPVELLYVCGEPDGLSGKLVSGTSLETRTLKLADAVQTGGVSSYGLSGADSFMAACGAAAGW